MSFVYVGISKNQQVQVAKDQGKELKLNKIELINFQSGSQKQIPKKVSRLFNFIVHQFRN